jgi:hypothetical protein
LLSFAKTCYAAVKFEIAIRLDPPASEAARLASDAHILVSSSGALSFHRLSGACAALEQACLSGAEIAAPLGAAVHAARSVFCPRLRRAVGGRGNGAALACNVAMRQHAPHHTPSRGQTAVRVLA